MPRCAEPCVGALGGQRLKRTAGESVKAIQVTGVQKLVCEQIRDGIDNTENDGLVQPCFRQDDDHGVSRGTSIHMRIPEAHGNAVRSWGLALLWIIQGAVGEQQMESVAIRSGDHGHGFAEAAEETLLAVMQAMRTKIKIAMSDPISDHVVLQHSAALPITANSRNAPRAEG